MATDNQPDHFNGILPLRRGAVFFAGDPRGGKAMPKLLAPGQAYAGRRDDAVIVNVTVDRDAATVLRRYCPEGRKGMGRFISRLIYEFDAREEERARLREGIVRVIEGENAL